MKIGVLGFGNMGKSMAKKLAEHNEVFAYDRNPQKVKSFTDKEIKLCDSSASLAKQTEIIILAIKPKDLLQTAAILKEHLSNSHILISLLGGTSIASLQEAFDHTKIIRAMPNMAVRYGYGVIGIAEAEHLTTHMKELIETIFNPLGTIFSLPEKMIDALASLTGSGPAFALVLIEAMIEAGVTMGFNATQAKELVIKMLTGTLEMLKAGDEHPAVLKLQIASPAGTTVAGLLKLEEHAVRYGIQQAFLAALNRTKQID